MDKVGIGKGSACEFTQDEVVVLNDKQNLVPMNGVLGAVGVLCDVLDDALAAVITRGTRCPLPTCGLDDSTRQCLRAGARTAGGSVSPRACAAAGSPSG